MLSCPKPKLNTMNMAIGTMVAKSLVYKKIMLKANVIAIPALMYFYWRHNTYCEPYIYSLFCILEYSVVLMNVGYHFSSYYLLYGMVVEIPSYEETSKCTSNLSDQNGCNQVGHVDMV